jgi:hypothetical protein
MPDMISSRISRTPYRRHGASRRADHRFRDEGGDRVRAEFENLPFEFVGETLREGLFGFVGTLLAVRVTRTHVMRFNQDRQERLAAPRIAADRQRAQRIAVITLAARDEMAALRLALLHEILAREFQRRLDRLRSAGHEVHMFEPLRRARHQAVGEFFGGRGGEERRVRVRQLLRLPFDRVDHALVAMAETRDGGAAGRVDIALAGGIDDLDAVARDGDRQRLFRRAMKNGGHGVRFLWFRQAPRRRLVQMPCGR